MERVTVGNALLTPIDGAEMPMPAARGDDRDHVAVVLMPIGRNNGVSVADPMIPPMQTIMSPVDPKSTRQRVKLVDEIIESLRRDIVTRRLPDGERLPSEKDLAERFGVSQPTAREAIRALETLGLVQVLHGNGSYVTSRGDFALASALQTLLQLQSVGIMEVLDVRQALGRYSIDVATEMATEEDLSGIAKSCASFERLDEVNDVDAVSGHVLTFQRAVSAASHNTLLQSLEAFLLSLLNEVQVNSLTNRDVRFWRRRAMEFQPLRLSILAGLRSRDRAVTRGAMDTYFNAQRRRFEQDKNLCDLQLSNPRLFQVAANIVRQFKA